MKKLVRLTEGDLHRIVKKSVNRVLKEAFTKPSNWKDTPFKGTYEDENGALYMPDDVYDEDEYSDDDFDGFGEDYDEEYWNRFERQHGY